MDSNIPTYYPGDVTMLRIRFHHGADIVDVWPNFERQEQVTSLVFAVLLLTLAVPAWGQDQYDCASFGSQTSSERVPWWYRIIGG